MTFDEWLNDAEPLILSNTYKEFHKRFGEAVWKAATLAERERYDEFSTQMESGGRIGKLYRLRGE